MTATRRKQAELLIQRNQIAIKYAGEGVARVREASRRSDERIKNIEASLRRAKSN
jgi:hypothetical protein